MSEFERFGEAALRGVDEQQLEVLRLRLVHEADDRRELVIDHLLLRGLGVITSVARQRAAAAGLAHEQLMCAIEEASVNLSMRLRRLEKLPPVTSIATKLAVKAVDARTPEPQKPAQLIARRPDLRPVDERFGDALRRGRVRRNNWRDS
jgi:hypothetical protein